MSKKKAIPKQAQTPRSFARVLGASKERTTNHGAKPRLRARIQTTLGREYNLFIEACCDTTVSTNAIWRALRDFGIELSYVWLLNERPKIQAEYGYYYEQARKNYLEDSRFLSALEDPEGNGALVHYINLDDLDKIPPVPSK